MKLRINFILLFVLCLIAFSCKKDNYAAPSSSLTGRVVYKGEPIQVEYNRVPFELYQYGFGRVGAINATIAPEGTFSHLLFDGDYKFIIRPGQGPFVWPETGGKADSIDIKIAGNTVRDIEVIPYYMIRSPQLSVAAGKVTGTFKIEKIITGTGAKDIESAALFLNKTVFVGPASNIRSVNIAGGTITDLNNVSLQAAIPSIIPTQNYIFARIGVKAKGVEDWIFSPVQKLQF